MKRAIFICLSFFLPGTVFCQWQQLYSDPSNSALQVQALNKDSVFVSYGDRLLKTTNGGATWDSIHFVNSQLFKMHFIDQAQGFVVGSASFPTGPTAFKTSDCGITWQPMNFVASAPYFNTDVYFLDKDTGFITDGSIIGKTVDGGQSFQTGPINIGDQINDIVFIDHNTGFAAAIYLMPGSFGYVENRIYKTTDQGLTWTVVHRDNDMGNVSFVFAGITKLFFADDTLGFAVGGEGKMLRTFDGGDTWTNIPNSFTDYTITDVQFFSAASGFICYAGRVYYTGDDMQTWQLRDDSLNPRDIYSLSMLNLNSGYGAGQGVFKTSNGGTTSLGNIPFKDVSVEVFPNPAKGFIMLHYNNGAAVRSLSLVDNTGKTIRVFRRTDKVLDVSGLAPGLYHLILRTELNIVSKTISLNQ